MDTKMAQTAYKEDRLEEMIADKLDREAGSNGDFEPASDMQIEVVTDEGSSTCEDLQEVPCEEKLADAQSKAFAVEIENRTIVTRRSGDRSVWSASGAQSTKNANRVRLSQNKVANEIFSVKDTRSKIDKQEVKKE
jgi:hypothetical protein